MNRDCIRLALGAHLAALLLNASAAAQAPLGTAFTYQGRLQDAGVPASGTYDLRFRLFDAASGGVQVGSTSCVDGVIPIDGLFNVSLDFGIAPFDGNARWLEIGVRSDATPGNCNGGSAYTVLTTRQPLTAVPYAMFALDGPGQAGFWAANGSAIYKTNSGAVGVGTNAPAAPFEVRATVDSRMRVAHISGSPFAVAGPAVLELKSNFTGSDLPFGAIRFLDGADAVVSAIEYGPGPSTLGLDDGMRFSIAGSSRMIISPAGNVGIGTVNPNVRLNVEGGTDTSLASGSGFLVLGNVGGTNVSFDNNEIMARNNGQTSLLALNAEGGDVTLIQAGVGNVAIGTTSPIAKLHVSTNNEQLAQFNQFGTDPGMQVTSLSTSTIYPALSVAGFSTNAPALRVTGTASVTMLEITGADVAERFPTSETREQIKPGLVMEIDPANPGHLRISRGAYNRRVAGIVSGAGDIPLGAILGNLPGHEDAPPIALSGRVYVHCVAGASPIEPGDLLTTAETPGHATSVRDYPRAQGAIIGKAMSRLDAGQSGLVLVLVNLQ